MSDEQAAARKRVTNRRERKVAETRQRIFLAAIDLFATREMEEVTIEQITERADVGKGTFFNHFTCKEDVITYFGGQLLERLREALAAGVVTGSCSERLLASLRVLAEYPGMTPELGRNLFTVALRNPPVEQRYGPDFWELHSMVAGIVREGQECGELRPELDVEQTSLFTLGLYWLGLLGWCSGFTRLTLPELVQQFAGMALTGICAPDPKPEPRL